MYFLANRVVKMPAILYIVGLSAKLKAGAGSKKAAKFLTISPLLKERQEAGWEKLVKTPKNTDVSAPFVE
jgi:hypothetical protein